MTLKETNFLNPALLPDFVVIGAGKSGTTSLDNYLSQHPDIFMSRMKEPDFFAYEQVDPTGLKGRDLAHYDRSIKTIEEYQKLFSDASPNQIKGETSNTCLSVKHAADRMKYYIPNAKLIAILRQPADRLFSRYMHLARINKLPSDSIEDVLDRSSIWWERKDLVREGFYADNLANFFKLFPNENIMVILAEDLKKDPKSTMNNIFEFLGVEKYDGIDYSVTLNKSGIIKNKFYDQTIGTNSLIKKTLKNVLPEKLFYKLSNISFLKKMSQKINDANLERTQLDPKIHDRITQEIYRDDILKLSELLHRDLSHWLEPKAKHTEHVPAD